MTGSEPIRGVALIAVLYAAYIVIHNGDIGGAILTGLMIAGGLTIFLAIASFFVKDY